MASRLYIGSDKTNLTDANTVLNLGSASGSTVKINFDESTEPAELAAALDRAIVNIEQYMTEEGST
jgi:hypothetical protein